MTDRQKRLEVMAEIEKIHAKYPPDKRDELIQAELRKLYDREREILNTIEKTKGKRR